jgi:hypothetical protein
VIKNTAGQKIGAQLVSASDGSAFTSAVTVAVTVDAGTQATGSVGSGACTHEGNGFHTYAPAQAETNGDHLAFTFTGTGAVPATVQVYPIAGDAFTRLGAPAGASVSADVAAVKAETATILADTAELQTDWANGGRLDVILDARASQTSVDDLPTNAELATSQAAADDATLAAIAALNNLSSAQAQTAAAAALTAYDPPTNAEMEARTLAAASYATAANQTTIIGYIDTEVAAIVAAIAALNDISEAEVLAQVNAALTATIADSVPADGTRPSISAGIYMLTQFMTDRAVSGTTATIRKPDGSTALFTLTLNDATTPTAVTRAS